MFWGIEDEELEKLYDIWMDERYFDRVLISVVIVIGLTLAPNERLTVAFAPLLFPFYLWGLLPLPA